MEATNINFEEMHCFQKYIPVSDCKTINFEEIHWFSEIYIYTCFGIQNINFEEIHWFSEIYTCFGLQKHQF